MIEIYETLHDLPLDSSEENKDKYFFKKGEFLVKFPFSNIAFHSEKESDYGIDFEMLREHSSIRLVSKTQNEIKDMPIMKHMQKNITDKIKETEVNIMYNMQELKKLQNELRTLREIHNKILL